jgi:glutamate racemase
VNRGAIGIFDSGIGGLTVARAIHELMPHEHTIYLGDTARVPYGPKSPATVRRYSHEILDWLLGQGVKAVVVACNTATAHALEALRAASPVPVIGVVEPGARAAAAATVSRRVAVIGTAGTIASGAYRRALHARDATLEVMELACPLFVPLVEEGWSDHPAARLVAEEYLTPVRQGGADTLVLGCTHYPLLKPLIASVVGPGVTLIDSANETARDVALALAERGLENDSRQPATHRWVATDDVKRFAEVGTRFTGGALDAVALVDLGATPVHG